MNTRVVNIKHKEPFDIYIGRDFAGHRNLGWGNPFTPGYNAHGVPDAIHGFRVWLLDHPKLIARLPELTGKTLGCWCAPPGGLPGNLDGHICHGEILAALADDPQQVIRLQEEMQTHAAVGVELERLAESLALGLCPECGGKIKRERQVGRCVYADPCGHRLYQGKALNTAKTLRSGIESRLAEHTHQWQTWGSDTRYERCVTCSAVRKVDAVERTASR